MQLKKNKPIKHLRFELTPKEYGDFWSIGDLVNLAKKKDILLEMMKIVRRVKENK